MGEEAEEGRPPGDGSQGRSAPAIRSVSADPLPHLRRAPLQGRATTWAGRRAVGGDEPRPPRPAHLAGCRGSRPLPLGGTSQSAAAASPPPPPAETRPRARPRRVLSPRTHTLAAPLPRAPASLLCPKGHHSRLAAQAGLGEPRVASGTRAQTRPLERRRVGAMTPLAPDPRGD